MRYIVQVGTQSDMYTTAEAACDAYIAVAAGHLRMVG